MALIIYIREENEQGSCCNQGREVLTGQRAELPALINNGGWDEYPALFMRD